MSGQFLNRDLALPCPPGLRIPEQQPYTITANTLKVTPLPLGGGWRSGGTERRRQLATQPCFAWEEGAPEQLPLWGGS